jgi:hypothetical protein
MAGDFNIYFLDDLIRDELKEKEQTRIKVPKISSFFNPQIIFTNKGQVKGVDFI